MSRDILPTPWKPSASPPTITKASWFDINSLSSGATSSQSPGGSSKMRCQASRAAAGLHRKWLQFADCVLRPTNDVRPKVDNPVAQYRSCLGCKKACPWVYEQGWMCLNPLCALFWTLDGKSASQDLSYSEAFLNASHPCSHAMLEDIAPQPPVIEATDGVVTSRRFTKGWHCKDCGRLSCR